jgi:hypothetical protein
MVATLVEHYTIEHRKTECNRPYIRVVGITRSPAVGREGKKLKVSVRCEGES